MANTNRSLRIFLCHSSVDKPVVRDLYQKLKTIEWIDPWLDEEKLYPGQDWDLEIERAVEVADAVIVCLSNNSVTKEGYVQRELKFALDIALDKPEGTIFVIPLRLEDCQLPRRLRSFQYANYFPVPNQGRTFQLLLVSLQKRAESLGLTWKSEEMASSKVQKSISPPQQIATTQNIPKRARRRYQTPEILHDAPLSFQKVADFHFDDFAATLSRLITSPMIETPLVIGINGAWGSGKTSLLLRIKNMLDHPKEESGKGEHRFAEGKENFRNCKTVWFDAWKYNDEDELLVALVRVILQAMGRDGFINKIKAWLDDPKQKSYDVFGMFINAFGISFGGLGAEFKFQLDPKKHEQISPFEKYTAFFDHFNDAFSFLLETWVSKDGILAIFIDDLDRCLPAKTVQILEAIKLFLDKSGCVFILGADTKIVQAAVETHYKNSGITGESARDYLEKIIQLRFDIPPIVETAMENYLRARNNTIVDEAILHRWQALVAAAEVNPRRVKSVINDLNLQWFMAMNSGQAEGVNRDDFICWQALMRAAPASFVKQVMDFEDKTIRFGFINDALKWQQGKTEDKDAVRGYFIAYEDNDSKRLRMTLRQISFSLEFTPDALESMIYMANPAPRIGLGMAPSEETPKIMIEPGLDIIESQIEEKMPSNVRLQQEEKESVLYDQYRRILGDVEFVRIPKGKFVIGSMENNDFALVNEKPQHTVNIPYDYWMARFLLTNERYAEYSGKEMHPVQGWEKQKDYPVVQVSWDDAMAYSKWFNETFKSDLGDLLVRLPTEAEWEKAARGAYGNEWPWGNEFDKNKCNSAEGGHGGTKPVGAHSFAGGDSPYGCTDMAGNVWQWTHSLYKDYPYEVTDGREDEKSRERRVLRGGSYGSNRDSARCAHREFFRADLSRDIIGFRVCLSNTSFEK